MPHYSLYIDGEFVNPVKGGSFTVVNPATEEVICQCPAGTEKDIDLAVSRARASFENGPWRTATGDERAKTLEKIATLIEERKNELARLETMNNGKPLCDSTADIQECADVFKYYAKMAREEVGKMQEITVCDENFSTFISKHPVGVVALITPFNYPLLMATWKVAPALAAGCSCILKPSEITPLTCLELAKIVHDAGLPKGVLNVVTGNGPDCGAPLANHPGIDKVAFTGSGPTGNAIYQAAAKDLKNVSLELGGKSAVIVFDDVDIDAAVEWVMFGIFNIGGQICSATSRLILHENIHDRFIARLKQCAEAIKVSNGLEDGCQLGPLVNKNQYLKVMGYIEKAKAEPGNTLVTGGGRPPHLVNAKGYFVSPTVFRVTPNSLIWREEIFGPVLSYLTFKEEREAISLANNSQFGLAGGVMTADSERGSRVAAQLEVGVAWVNCSQPAFREAPWGGIKRSGLQSRDLGHWGFDTFSYTKQTTVAKDRKRMVGFYTLPAAKM